jgi:hypothetical protein
LRYKQKKPSQSTQGSRDHRIAAPVLNANDPVFDRMGRLLRMPGGRRPPGWIERARTNASATCIPAAFAFVRARSIHQREALACAATS